MLMLCVRRTRAYNKLIISFYSFISTAAAGADWNTKKNIQKTQDLGGGHTSQRSRNEKMKREDNDRYNRYTIFVLFKTMG